MIQKGDILLFLDRSGAFSWFVLTLVAGCSLQDGVVPVSGRVSLNGQPLAGATVTFQPIRGEGGVPAVGGSVGRTDDQGRFELRLAARDEMGAAVGQHRVTITTATAPEGDDTKLASGERVPLAWRNGSKKFDVPTEGTSQADFAIAVP